MRNVTRVVASGVAAVALVAGPGATQAVAAGHGTAAAKLQQGARKASTRIAVRRIALRAAAQYLGFASRKALRQAVAGHSLAQLAASRQKSVEGLKRAMVDAVKAALDKTVASQRLKQRRANKILARFQKQLDGLVNKVFPARS
jgi:hypothetical protein